MSSHVRASLVEERRAIHTPRGARLNPAAPVTVGAAKSGERMGALGSWSELESRLAARMRRMPAPRLRAMQARTIVQSPDNPPRTLRSPRTGATAGRVTQRDLDSPQEHALRRMRKREEQLIQPNSTSAWRARGETRAFPQAHGWREALSPDDVSTAAGSGSDGGVYTDDETDNGDGTTDDGYGGYEYDASGSVGGTTRSIGRQRPQSVGMVPAGRAVAGGYNGARPTAGKERQVGTGSWHAERPIRPPVQPGQPAAPRTGLGAGAGPAATPARINDGPAFGGPLLRPTFYYKLVAALPRRPLLGTGAFREPPGQIVSQYTNISDGSTVYKIGHTLNLSVHQRARRAGGHAPGFVVYETVEAALACRLPARSKWLHAAPALLRLTVGGVGQRLGDERRRRWLFSQIRPVEVIAEGTDMHLVL